MSSKRNEAADGPAGLGADERHRASDRPTARADPDSLESPLHAEIRRLRAENMALLRERDALRAAGR